MFKPSCYLGCAATSMVLAPSTNTTAMIHRHGESRRKLNQIPGLEQWGCELLPMDVAELLHDLTSGTVNVQLAERFGTAAAVAATPLGNH